jgi:hypothetical protein
MTNGPPINATGAMRLPISAAWNNHAKFFDPNLPSSYGKDRTNLIYYNFDIWEK